MVANRPGPQIDCPDVDLKEQRNTLPPEIWLKIFPYLSLHDIRASTLSCSSFRKLSQPLLFTIIDVSPFFLAYNTDRRVLRPRKYLDRTIQRLEFYRSPSIAPAVKYCWISPYSRTGFPPRNPRDYLDPHLIIDAVISSLPFFVNLYKLAWHCTDISAKWWRIIHKLPITSLWLNSCMVEGVDPSPLPVQYLDLDQWAWEGEVTNHVSIHEEHSQGVSQATLPLLLHPYHTQYISVPRVNTCYRLLSTIAEMDHFTSLLVLHIPFSAISSPCFIRALVHCSTLEELQIFKPNDGEPRDFSMDYLPPSALLYLAVYEGPYFHVLTFAAGRPLKKISLWGLDEPPALCNPHLLLDCLRRVSLFNHNLETLQVAVSRITVDLLAILSSFPILKCVEITSADNPSLAPVTSSLQLSHKTPMTVLYILLRSITLPPKLETLRISTKLNHGNLDTPTQELEVSRLIENMALTHPILHSVEISYGTYWTGTYLARWSRLASSSEKDGTLGRLFFNERRRTIVFPDAHRSEKEWDQNRLAQGGFSFVMWLRQLYYKYL